jgi:uncharacterized protein YciI
MPERLHLLTYTYVDDVLDRRGPHRPEHLEHVERWKASGRLLLAGAVGEPPHSALFVLRVDDPAEAEAFADSDPYVAAHLVTSRRVEPWNVV